MTKENVLNLINILNEKQTETLSIETKSANKGKPKFHDTISAFANTIGGVILFGVEEKKVKNESLFEVVGVYDANDLQKYVTNLCSREFEPVIRPSIDVVNVDGKYVVAVGINSLNTREKPCYYKPQGLHNGSYIRVGDRDDHMTEYEIYKFLSYRDDVHDDLRPVVRATLEDLDGDMLDEFIEKFTENKPKFSKFTREEILLNAEILTKVEDKLFPTVAGVMIFGINPQRFFPQWFIAGIVVPGFEIAHLGKLGERFIDNVRIDGDIITMYREAIKFLKRNMKVGMRLDPKTGLREDLPEYPIDGLREAVSNMLLHRDYSQFKEGVYSKITVFKDRISFRNVGNLYGGNTIEKLKDSEVNVEVRNKTIVNLIEIMGGVVENRHTGIKTMEEEMNRFNLPSPILKNEREDFVVNFYNGEYPEYYPEEIRKSSMTQNKKTQGMDRYQDMTQDMTQDERIKRISKILEFCNVPRSISEIMNEFGYRSRKSFNITYMIPLLESGKLEMTLPDKPTSRYQKYVTKK